MKKGRMIIAAAAIAAPMAGAGALGLNRVDTARAQEVADPAAESEGAALATRIRAELAVLPGTPTAEDLEASMMFVIGQGRYGDKVIDIALTLVGSDAGARPALIEAIKNVRLALARRPGRGTAAIDEGFGINSAFSTPILGVGGGSGGSSNYET